MHRLDHAVGQDARGDGSQLLLVHRTIEDIGSSCSHLADRKPQVAQAPPRWWRPPGPSHPVSNALQFGWGHDHSWLDRKAARSQPPDQPAAPSPARQNPLVVIRHRSKRCAGPESAPRGCPVPPPAGEPPARRHPPPARRRERGICANINSKDHPRSLANKGAKLQSPVIRAVPLVFHATARATNADYSPQGRRARRCGKSRCEPRRSVRVAHSRKMVVNPHS